MFRSLFSWFLMVFGASAAPKKLQKHENTRFWRRKTLRTAQKPSKITKKVVGTIFFRILGMRNVMNPKCVQGRRFTTFLAGCITLLKLPNRFSEIDGKTVVCSLFQGFWWFSRLGTPGFPDFPNFCQLGEAVTSQLLVRFGCSDIQKISTDSNSFISEVYGFAAPR